MIANAIISLNNSSYNFHYRFVKNKIIWWIRKFKKPYAAIRNGQRQEKKGIRQIIVSLAKKLLWINETIEKGQSKIFRYGSFVISRICFDTKYYMYF